MFHRRSKTRMDTHLSFAFWTPQPNLPIERIKGSSERLNSGNMIGIYNLPSKLLFPLKLLSRYPFLPISPLARTAYTLRRFSRPIGTPMISTCHQTPWFLRKILACTLRIFLHPPSWFKPAKYLEKDITRIPGLTAWANTLLRTSRKFTCTQV